MSRRSTPIDDPEVTGYVEQVGRRLAAAMPSTKKPNYSFAVIQDDPTGITHEPLGLPGGYVFVSARLLLDARDEAEFAGMLAHGMWQAASGRVSSEAAKPLVYMGGLQSQNVPLGALQPLRAQVREADFMAAQIMLKAGYDPRALVRYIARVQPDGAPDPHSPRPSRAARVASLESIIAELPASRSFDRMQKQIQQLLTRPAPSLRVK